MLEHAPSSVLTREVGGLAHLASGTEVDGALRLQPSPT